MAKDIPSKKYKGVYYRELKNGDRSYFLILRIDGKQKRISIGKKSEGVTESYCYQHKVNIINAEKFGDEEAALLQRKKRNDPTFIELLEYYLQHSPAKASSKKIVKYLANQVPFKDKRKITVDDLLSWQSELVKTVSQNTADSKINQVSSVLNFAISAGKYKHDNPAHKVKRFNPDDNRLRYLSREEVDRLLEHVKAMDDKPLLYLFVKLALSTGARVSTLMEIRAEHIKGEKIRLYNVKTGQFYTGYLDEETQQLLKNKTGYVLSWYGPEDKPQNQDYQWRMRRVFDELFNQGVTESRDRVVIHTLRHTVASLMVQNGTPLQVVQKVLNHKSIRSTERYAKLHDDNVKNELTRLWQ